MTVFQRKPNRLPPHSYLGPRSYFLTLCTGGRKELFTNAQRVDFLLDLLRLECSAYSFGVYAYCFMPDHLHLVLVGKESSAHLARLVRTFKGVAVARARALGTRRLWQRGFYDHVIRAEQELNRVAWYVFTNPVRAGLVPEAREWPFSGSWLFDWKKVTAPAEAFVPPWKK